MQVLPQHTNAFPSVKGSNDAPWHLGEYAYYFSLFYATVGPGLGLPTETVSVGMITVLAAYCVMCLGPRARRVYALIALPLGCAISSLVIQLTVQGESLMEPNNRGFINWILALIIVQSFTVRQGFLHRFALATFFIGLTMLPYLQLRQQGRFGLDAAIGYSNSNDFAAWFGFCFVYFMVSGLETKRYEACVASWLAAAVSLFVVGLTVSRGTLLTVALTTVIVLRRTLKRSFLPVLVLMIAGWIIFALGLFDQIAAHYAERGMEETGRLSLWPVVIGRILGSPLVGVGVSNVTTRIPQHNFSVTPHNSFLYIALASGIIPSTFFVAYWWRAARDAFRAYAARVADAQFCLPLLIYTFMIAQQSTGSYMFPWSVVTLSSVITAGVRCRARHVVVRRMARYQVHSYRQRILPIQWGG